MGGIAPQRPDPICRSGQVFLSVMRHFLAVRPLTIGMPEPTVATLLVEPTCRTHRLAPRRTPTPLRTVAVAAITATAQKKHPATVGTGADDEAKRIQAGARFATNWTADPDACDNVVRVS